MTSPTRFDGIFTALVTPFTAAGAIDWAALDRLVVQQIEAGIAGLVPVGTTGEAATLSEAEQLAVISHVVNRADGAAYVMAGAGTNDTARTLDTTRRATEAGVDGVLLITPYYNRPSQEGLVAHFTAVATTTRADVMLYSVPARTGVTIAAETAAELSRSCGNIVAIKEAGGDPGRVTTLRAACGPDFAVHCGDDGLALPFYALGACGLTSVLSNLRPRDVVRLHQAWRSGDHETALALHDHLAPLAAAMFLEPSPGPVKHALAIEGLIEDKLRLPMMPVSAAADRHLRSLMGQATGQ
ncbi:4-hydroxy-tetrahydrodipicolinate synthase [Solirhodobacter olei]|uniref:4-hydroxy-tetrahydrodipicolinate synthase n=1 Tax=Solirhodobacter olei TaxID=2493082 RepID=UPI000FD8428D|nr:4-hydroxy-tetrahydrodipicolinate synthase [Solirhodobacter olei]